MLSRLTEQPLRLRLILLTVCVYAMLIQNADTDPGPYYITGNALNATVGRLAYILRLQGPALAIDTACSSSLVAVHQACASLRNDQRRRSPVVARTC